jgi:hypothetical protein
MGKGPPEMYQCNDCGASWSESKATKCIHCLSNNIFIFWYPGMKIKPKRLQLQIKKVRRIKIG